MNIKKIEDSVNQIEYFLKLHEYTFPIKRYIPYGELMLGKRNLYPSINSEQTRFQRNDQAINGGEELRILLTTLSYCDGSKNIVDIINLKKLNIEKSFKVLKKCLKLKLVYMNI